MTTSEDYRNQVGGGGGTVDTQARTLAAQALALAQADTLQDGETIAAGEGGEVLGFGWTNPTAGPLAIPASPTVASIEAAGFVRSGGLSSSVGYEGAHVQADAYDKDDIVLRPDGLLYRANDDVPAGTAFAEGTAGATWAAVSSDADLTPVLAADGEPIPPGEIRFYAGRLIENTTAAPINAATPLPAGLEEYAGTDESTIGTYKGTVADLAARLVLPADEYSPGDTVKQIDNGLTYRYLGVDTADANNWEPVALEVTLPALFDATLAEPTQRVNLPDGTTRRIFTDSDSVQNWELVEGSATQEPEFVVMRPLDYCDIFYIHRGGETAGNWEVRRFTRLDGTIEAATVANNPTITTLDIAWPEGGLPLTTLIFA